MAGVKRPREHQEDALLCLFETDCKDRARDISSMTEQVCGQLKKFFEKSPAIVAPDESLHDLIRKHERVFGPDASGTFLSFAAGALMSAADGPLYGTGAQYCDFLGVQKTSFSHVSSLFRLLLEECTMRMRATPALRVVFDEIAATLNAPRPNHVVCGEKNALFNKFCYSLFAPAASSLSSPPVVSATQPQIPAPQPSVAPPAIATTPSSLVPAETSHGGVVSTQQPSSSNGEKATPKK